MDHDRGWGIGDHKRDMKEEDSHWTMAMVSSSTGTINCLLNKLPTEMKFAELRPHLEGIQHHLLGFCAQGVVTDMLDREWMKQLRELVYDIEDWIDMHLIRSWDQFEPDKLSLDHSNLLQEFKDRISDLQDLGKQFGFLKVGFIDLVPSKATLDLEDNTPGKIMHVDWMCGKGPCIVGLSGPESEIAHHLMDSEQELKVVSILGPGGLGKTTLAREVFRKQRGQFDCGALVYVGQYPSIAATLMDIAHQVMPKSLVPCEEKLVTNKLWKFLYTKRYLIVIDDMWSISAWSSITCAFPENNLGSRILTTTEDESLARFCCVKPIDFVYLLKPLADGDSRLLMLNRISFLEKDSLIDPEILESILKMCFGRPLALVVATGLLTTKGDTHNLSMMRQDYRSEEMTNILNMCYNDLPLHLKSCFLYLSAFSENCTISKDRLIRRWIAEGFIPARKGESLWGVGESYFNEIAMRGLIQLVFDDNDAEIGCTVHNIIHKFTRSLSTEDNFVTVGEYLSSKSYPCDTMRRFTHDCSKQFESGVLSSMTVHLSKVRSLAVSGNTNKEIDVWNFKLVRVLDLEGATGLGKRQLRSIRNLLLLRYLSLRGSDVCELPKKMEMLQHLATVDLRQTKVKHLPRLETAKLVSLLADHLVIPSGMDEMLELEELSMILVGHRYSMENAAKLIRKSKLLRVLGVRFEYCNDKVELKRFLAAVNNSNLQTLLVDDYGGIFLYALRFFRFHIHSCQLKKFELNISRNRVQKVPAEIACLKDLTHLRIIVHELEAEGLHILEELPNLVLLHLDLCAAKERCIISNLGSFQCLKVFWLRCLDTGMGLQFGPGVMPQLRRFKLVFSAVQTEHEDGEFDFGIQNLTGLEHVSVTVNRSTPALVAAITDQVSKIPNNPLLELRSILTEQDVA